MYLYFPPSRNCIQISPRLYKEMRPQKHFIAILLQTHLALIVKMRSLNLSTTSWSPTFFRLHIFSQFIHKMTSSNISNATGPKMGVSNAGWIVQSLVHFNPGLNQNSSSDFFSKEEFTVVKKYCLDFPKEKKIIPKPQLKAVCIHCWEQKVIPKVSANRLLNNWAQVLMFLKT